MNKRKFVQSRRPHWTRFRKLLDMIETRQAKKLSAAEISEYSTLLREVSNDLAIIRSREWGRDISEYLNSLVTRGYNSFYSSPPGRIRDAIRFLLFGFPALLRENGMYFLIAWMLLFPPMFVTWGIIQANPSLATAILPAAQLEGMEQMYAQPLYGETIDRDDEERGDALADIEEVAENEANEEDDWDEVFDSDPVVEGYYDERSTMAGFYVWNNVGIALQCFVIGILAGIGTCYILLSNAIVMGATAGYILAAGHDEQFLSFVVTHGSFELTAIAVAGGAGLMLGNAVIHRGDRSLEGSLVARGLPAVKIAIGAAFMLFIAAGLEAFWSPAPIDPQIKYIVGGASWVFVYAWLLLAGKRAEV